MPTAMHNHSYRTTPLIITLIIILQANLQEALASPVSLQLPTPLTAEGEKQDNAQHSLHKRYYHANPSTLRTSTVDSHQRVLQFERDGVGIKRLNNGIGNQQAATKGVRIVRNVRLPRTGQSETEDIGDDNDYRQERTQQQVDNISSFYPSRKRGFSVLARWKPFTNISKLRVSSRQQQQQLLRPMVQAQAQQLLSSAVDDYDVISAETRAMLLRPSGQPLRWG